MYMTLFSNQEIVRAPVVVVHIYRLVGAVPTIVERITNP